MGQLRSDIGVWVVGAVALIALVVFGGLWLMQTSLLSRLDGISRDARRQNEKLQARVAALQGEVTKLEARLAGRGGGPEEEASVEEETTPPRKAGVGRVYVRVTSRPSGARVRRGGRTLGRTPLVLPMKKGEINTLVIVKGGYAEEQVTVKAEDGSSLDVRLRRRSARSGAALLDPNQ